MQELIERKPAITKIVDVVRASAHFLLASHVNPDGDSLGSLLGLAETLRALGKQAVIYSADKIPDNYAFLAAGEDFRRDLPALGAFDVVFILDCGELSRVGGEHGKIASAKMLVNIDHHHSNRRFCPLTLLDGASSSTAELVLEVVLSIGVEITPRIANCLYAGILTDTGGFRYSSTKGATLLAAGRLVDAGANPQWLSENIYENNPRPKLDLLAAALRSLSFAANGRISWMTVRQQDLADTGALLEHTDGMVELPRSVAGVKVALLFTEIAADYYKVSLRSKEAVDVASVAGSFGGGGHVNAAACRIAGKIETLIPLVVQAVENILGDRLKNST